MNDIPHSESLNVEFKSDRNRLPDTELLETAVCLANADGGQIFLGVEDNGDVTGLDPTHRDPNGLIALIANRTVPPLSVRAEILQVGAHEIIRVEVPRSLRPVATSEGRLLRRRLRLDGKPECAPFYPHEVVQRQSDLGALDYSALPVAGATLHDFDPLERQRLRTIIDRYNGERSLLNLTDEELDGALSLVVRDGATRVPTVTGLLLLGTEAALREKLPTHEIALQELVGTDVRRNDFFRWPLLRVFERIVEWQTLAFTEQEVQMGMFRVPVPDLDSRAFREALVNAFVHRDYARLGAVHIRKAVTSLTITNPGGFIEGVSLDNLLVVEPRPRNPTLADAVKRIGLAERTGRGVDLIYEGMLRFGRPEPDYTRSSPQSVVVELTTAQADIPFLQMIINEENRTNARTSLEQLIVLSRMREQRRLTFQDIAIATQRPDAQARAIVERLVERGVVTAHGATRARTYTLSPAFYRAQGDAAAYVHQAGFDALQQEQMVMSYVRAHGRITRAQVMGLCNLNINQAGYLLLHRLHDRLESKGRGRGGYYKLRGGTRQ